jgi:hypothetical protein
VMSVRRVIYVLLHFTDDQDVRQQNVDVPLIQNFKTML